MCSECMYRDRVRWKMKKKRQKTKQNKGLQYG